MKNVNNSSFIGTIMIIIILFTFISYHLLKENMLQNHQKERSILFYMIELKTSALLSNLLFEYTQEREKLFAKHKEVMDILKNLKDPLNADLSKLYKSINAKDDDLYQIYISDKNLIIRNSTYKKDIGFNLSFAKETFDADFEKNVTGICAPLFEKSSKKFMSYSSEYFIGESGAKSYLLQVSYTYKQKRFFAILKLLEQYPNIVDAKAYIILKDGFIDAVSLKDFQAYKADLQEILSQIKEGKKVAKELHKTTLRIRTFEKNATMYTEMSLLAKSPIVNNTEILYSILLNEKYFYAKIFWLQMAFIALFLFEIIAIYFIYRVQKREKYTHRQDAFIQSSMHEIKTPLSIITLNNELRELEFGRDEYSREIGSAIKTLKNSYEDMSFTLTKDKMRYLDELLSLEDVVQERVLYFKSMAESQNKTIHLSTQSSCSVMMSHLELIRLIDNNLSNALKYSENGAVISVNVTKNILEFHNYGIVIQNAQRVFVKYVRESSVVGGHGLGLFIVKDIADKYGIEIDLNSSQKEGTKFSYSFKCHTNDIS